MRKALFRDEGGFTAVGAAVALLLVFSLTFAGIRVMRVQSESADIQYVADAAALAADNAVAEFVTLGQTVDAALLSLNLLGLTTCAAAVVAAFIPGGQGASTKLADVATKIFKVRDKAAKTAVKGLNAAQKALPALCALRASACVKANAKSEDYYGFAVPFPLEGVEYKLADTSEVDEAVSKLGEQNEKASDAVEWAQELQEKMDAAKEEAWLADCGSNGMNMRERAGHLAGLAGARNPDYSTVETWSFAVPLARANAYYRQRYENEPGASSAGSPELVGESVARKRFYAYALEEVSRNTVLQSDNGSEFPHFVHLARNTAQVRTTRLYTEALYPLSSSESGVILHAYSGCPGYTSASPAGTGSVSMIDAGTAGVCDQCQFSAKTLGRVPAASTSIDNGFEHYYRKVADAADRYCSYAQQAEEVRDQLEESKKSAVDAFKKGLKGLKGARYDPQPPGRYGCVCVVFAQRREGDQLPFVAGDTSAGSRMAISGACLAPDNDCDQGALIREIGENLLPQQTALGTVTKKAFAAWSSALAAYSGANDAVIELLDKVVGGLPLVGTELSSWVVKGFEDAVEKAGLKPANLQTYKPVLVNTAHIASRDDGAAAKMLLSLKTGAQAYGDIAADDLESLAKTLEVPDKLEDIASDGVLEILKLPLSKFGLGTKDTGLEVRIPQGHVAAVRNAEGSGS